MLKKTKCCDEPCLKPCQPQQVVLRRKPKLDCEQLSEASIRRQEEEALGPDDDAEEKSSARGSRNRSTDPRKPDCSQRMGSPCTGVRPMLCTQQPTNVQTKQAECSQSQVLPNQFKVMMLRNPPLCNNYTFPPYNQTLPLPGYQQFLPRTFGPGGYPRPFHPHWAGTFQHHPQSVPPR
ncbi:unnamed protein product [Cyprideis torosa]|uniref:Uncharacterized protein n=1 Tax=Cyprideis torosa TaxID=163714 RepID=A0A7R8ZQD9_9CRUS|nr:unnamed protein product [Cyprideis torosa]CAG0890434.1 unnamed protein product [Cyprideis torosa]